MHMADWFLLSLITNLSFLLHNRGQCTVLQLLMCCSRVLLFVFFFISCLCSCLVLVNCIIRKVLLLLNNGVMLLLYSVIRMSPNIGSGLEGIMGSVDRGCLEIPNLKWNH